MMSQPNPGADDEAALLSRVALGDRAAFARLYERSAARLLGVVLRIERNRSQAEDILQEVFIKVWRSAASFDAGRAQAATWLASVARNAAIDGLRRRAAQPATVSTTRHDDDDTSDLLQDFIADEPGPAQHLEQAAERRALQRCLGVLNGDQCQAVALAFYQGLSYAEVAEHLRQPLGTVKSWVRRGLQALKGCLEGQAAKA
jgi:RNA polymerase sigma factor (sigma-70 family)